MKMIERLTERNWKDKCAGYTWNVHPVEHINDLRYYKKLAEYEDLEEQGLLLKLQFKKGQKVYYVDKSYITGLLFVASMTYSYSCLDFPRDYFGTKEEAEERLRELEDKQNETE